MFLQSFHHQSIKRFTDISPVQLKIRSEINMRKNILKHFDTLHLLPWYIKYPKYELNFRILKNVCIKMKLFNYFE